MTCGANPRIVVHTKMMDVPVNVLSLVFASVAAPNVLACTAVCARWREHARRTWRLRIRALAASRKFIGKALRAPLARVIAAADDAAPPEGVPLAQLFFALVRDGTRVHLDDDELAGLDWCFRWKAAVADEIGEDVIALDPWWSTADDAARPPIALQLRGAGVVTPLNDARPFFATHLDPLPNVPDVYDGTTGGDRDALGAPSSSHTWRHVVVAKPDGSGSRSTVEMLGMPVFRVSRHGEHAGVFMHSCWCVMTGFPMAPRGADPHVEDGALDHDASTPVGDNDAGAPAGGDVDDDDDRPQLALP